MKRKAEAEIDGNPGNGILKKRVKTILSEEAVHHSFRQGLFSAETLDTYRKAYAEAEPYKHSVIDSLINDALLRSVRHEIRDNVHFTPKETDIYKIHQSGDLANLDGLDDGALEKLPSLLKLRDVLYSSSFRDYISTITGSGALSGRKTDMAINVYTPGCHLLCHDDVIGSRRVSYILYLTDPDTPWKAEWGGALRLYSTKSWKEKNGETTKTPSPVFSKSIPPAWNQLCFFAVQPGESFHDVEEVYHTTSEVELKENGGRVRMAISGWYHIPQLGEEGYVKGAEEKWGANSSLIQLQGHPDRYDFPQIAPQLFELEEPSLDGFETKDLDFLLKYMAPMYLTPDTLEQIADRFEQESCVTLEGILSPKFTQKLKVYIETQEATPLPDSPIDIEQGFWKIAKPPHKHRFLYRQPPQSSLPSDDSNPLDELTACFLPSKQFRKWLEIATGCQIEDHDVLSRRFRKGVDYTLASCHEGKARLEMALALTPTTGWVAEEDHEADQEDATDVSGDKTEVSVARKSPPECQKSDSEGDASGPATERAEVQPNGHAVTSSMPSKTNGNSNDSPTTRRESREPPDHGGHEVYMASDPHDEDDAAIYRSTQEAEDDNVLFTMPASWNNLSIVLRDSGVLKFVKYVSKNAPGDRWDIVGNFGVREGEENEVEVEDVEGQGIEHADFNRGGDGGTAGQVSLEDSDQEVWNGFGDSEESESD